jgi:hypothetical protein
VCLYGSRLRNRAHIVSIGIGILPNAKVWSGPFLSGLISSTCSSGSSLASAGVRRLSSPQDPQLCCGSAGVLFVGPGEHVAEAYMYAGRRSIFSGNGGVCPPTPGPLRGVRRGAAEFRSRAVCNTPERRVGIELAACQRNSRPSEPGRRECESSPADSCSPDHSTREFKFCAGACGIVRQLSP